MRIFVDADSCPKAARELVQRAALRLGIPAFFAANRPVPGVEAEAMLLCPIGENAADNRIAETAGPEDLVVTRDVPLAARLVRAGVSALDDRGRVYTEETIGERLSLRDWTVGLAENGLDFERTRTYGKRELKTFADSLDRLLVKLGKKTLSGGAAEKP